jgi:Na+/melibiose symporter-like transporter
MHTLTERPSLQVRWQPVTALAGVNAAITLSWIIYRIYLVNLVTRAGFPAGFAPFLLLIESILAIVVEPWAGNRSDQTLGTLGGRFHVILIGCGLTSLLFVLLPGIVDLLQPNAANNWWLPGLLVLWAVAISMFRSPALALLGQYAEPEQLPQAASLITLAGALAASATPLATPLLQQLGLGPAFGIAAILLLVAVGWFRYSHTVQESQDGIPERLWSGHRLSGLDLLRIFGLGLGATLTLRLAVDLFPKLLKAAGLVPPPVMGALFISLGIGALGAGLLAKRWSYLRVMVWGFGLSAAGLVLMLSQQAVGLAAFGIAAVLGIGLGLIFNGTLPFALNFAPRQAGLGVGLFYAGAAAATSLQSSLLSQISAPIGIGLGLVGLVVAGVCAQPHKSPITSAT